jgi:hypothetical protein
MKEKKMPCSDGGQYKCEQEEKARIKRQKEIQAMLCAVLTVLYNNANLSNVLSQVDEAESGITEKSIKDFWEKHKKEDEARRKREREMKEKIQRETLIKQQALFKLTKEEKEVLGVKL